jgi:hypothetical protein
MKGIRIPLESFDADGFLTQTIKFLRLGVTAKKDSPLRPATFQESMVASDVQWPPRLRVIDSERFFSNGEGMNR